MITSLFIRKYIIIMEALQVLEHKHPLKLVDLQLQLQNEEEEKEDGDADADEDDDGDDVITKEGFRGACDRCGEEINVYHRHYYKCMADSSCDFSLHKFCGEIPTRLEIAFHPHPLTMFMLRYNWSCNICGSKHKPGELRYICFECEFWIDVNCAVDIRKRIIHHPCHPHLLTCAITKPVLCDCSACGRRHEGMFYNCTTCTNFTIHSECAFLSKSLLIQERTHGAFYHTHPLTISYSFPREDQKAKHDPRCRVCGHDFRAMENLWIYKCDECMYYTHVDCATSRREPFMSIFLPPGVGRTRKNYKVGDHRHLLHLPFPDETYSLPKHLFFQQTDHHHKVNLTHISHRHPLILVDHTLSNGQNSSSSWLLKCHNPMKKTQLLCNGCLKPITATMPFYRCATKNDDQIQIQGVCNNFALHEWCTRLPPVIENHPGHPQHTLHLIYSNIPGCKFDVFKCNVCYLHCNGFAYGCAQCKYYVDVTCGLIPKEITHKAHPNHLLSIVNVEYRDDHTPCYMCRRHHTPGQLSFRCDTCDIYIHPECALLLAKTVNHKYDKHPMKLSYLPIENHKSEYFCEICEEDLNPHQSFYHCHDCVQSIHTACAPLILQSETHTYIRYQRSTYEFVNIKFGGIQQGRLTLAQGLMSDGECRNCGWGVQYEMVFKRFDYYKFVVHYRCYK
ncbi:uncharacterized protein LOC111898877 [Lactuca sativa]|uniref:DC1 domain-containing protein n=1 Tax=Lactuca sativa TaxID=4236 RepID=A0A9R1UQ54_LACSA|nr:uncharacterized protein LOC111898877 [Lactuca sativa]KAJ0190920.1 hypothetical protein LSAT_V11C800420880 [Lactuca sativa]